MSTAFQTLKGQPPIVIAHRGASGERPEHTLEAYQRAIASGADFIEPDLVVTKDGVLVARHENALATINSQTKQVVEATTDVAVRPEFAERLTTKIVDGRAVTGWFAEDFTLAELKTLNARERLPQLRGTEFDGQGLKIPTLPEIIQLIKQTESETGVKVGIYPETKHPTYFAQEGTFLDGTPIRCSLGQQLIDTLLAENFRAPCRVFIQSFEVSNLQELAQTIMPAAGVCFPLVQLIAEAGSPYDFVVNGDGRSYAELCTLSGLAYIATYASAIGPSKRLVIPEQHHQLLAPTTLIEDAHAAGLLVHVYTLRHESIFLAADYHGSPEAEYEQLIHLGVDGYFTDFPAMGQQMRSQFSADALQQHELR
ncbi:MAG: glycerophosphodiester phosphodiesterase [Cyanophyceae cyanobacterium]